MRKVAQTTLPSLSIRIDLGEQERIGPGKIQLLENINSCGSISAAGRVVISRTRSRPFQRTLRQIKNKRLEIPETGISLVHLSEHTSVSGSAFVSLFFSRAKSLFGGIAMSRRVLCGILAGMSFCTQLFAAEGKFDGVSCYAGPVHIIQQGDGITAGSYEGVGISPGQEGTPYFRMSGRCLGQFTVINGDYNETGSCQFWNANGDKIFGVYSRKGDPAKAEGIWHVVQATGKLEGMTSEGKFMPIAAFPPVPNTLSTCNHEWGTYNTK